MSIYDINLLRHKSSCQRTKRVSLLSSSFLARHVQWNFCLKGPLLSLVLTHFRAQEVLCSRVAHMNTLTDAQENEVAAAHKISLLASLLSLLRSTFFLWSSVSGELEN